MTNRDATTTPDTHHWAENFYRGAPSPAHLVLFDNAGHGDWGFTGPVTDVSKRAQMALLLSRLKGYTGLEAYLPGGDDLDTSEGVTLTQSK